MKTISLILTLFLLSCTSGCKKKNLIEWPPRTGLHDAEAAKEGGAELKNKIDIKTNISETTDGSGSFRINKESSKISGTLNFQLGSIVKEAHFGALGDIFSDPAMSKYLSYAYLLTSGEILLSVDELLKEPPQGVYVQNRFEIIDFGPRYVLLRMDPVKKHQLAVVRFDQGEYIGTANWPGTKAEFQDNVIERKEDGWYVGNVKLKSRKIESIPLTAKPLELQENMAQEVIELAIAICLGDVPNAKLSPSLTQKVERSKLHSGFFLAVESPIRITTDGNRWTLPTQWTAVPQNFTNDSELSDANGLRIETTVRLRGGEIGISNGNVFVSEYTEAQIGKQEYIFREGKWVTRR